MNNQYINMNELDEEFIKIKSNKDQFNHHLNLLNNNSHPNVKILEREQDEKTKKFKINLIQ